MFNLLLFWLTRHVAKVIAKKTNDTNHIKLGFFVNSIITDIINSQGKTYPLDSLSTRLIQS